MMEFLKEIFKKLGGLNAKMIHIAGSKGKGTTAFLTAEALNAAGFKVGLFTSPAIFCYEEMIRVNMEEISTEALIELIAKVKVACDGREISKFEEITLAAYLYFKEENCDYVVVETGIGGRLDSTNIVDNKILTILTHIELEHQEILGDSIDKITREKLGISRPGVPLLTPSNQHLNVMEEISKSGLTPVLCSSFELGNHHPEACGLAFYALDLLGITVDARIIERMKNLLIPGHFEIKKLGIHTLLLDGAHTFDSIQSLHEKVLHHAQSEGLPSPTWVFHILKDKPRELVKLFLNKRSIWMEIENERAAETPENFTHANAKEILENLKNEVIPQFMVFTGSFRVVADIKMALGEKPSHGLFV